MHIRNSIFLGKFGDLGAQVRPVFIWVRVSRVLVVIVGRETDADSFGANGGSDCADDFKWEAAAILDRATVGIGAFIHIVMEKLFEEVAIRSEFYG